ncbi:MAG: hypothetical protein ACOZF0_05075 [Thermodesulfobacteriota bacterium]
MELFETQFQAIRDFLAAGGRSEAMKTLGAQPVSWPAGLGRNLILSRDTAVELGNPREASTSFILWTGHRDKVMDGRIRLLGPDLPASRGRSLPFGKVVLIHGDGFTPDNTYPRYREMEGLRYQLDLRGYMLRAVSQYQREWSRVSWGALETGFSFSVLGRAIIDQYRAIDYVGAVEILFVTDAPETVRALQAIGDQAGRVVGALNRMSVEMSFDCDSCEYVDVCGDVAALRAMRRNPAERTAVHG